MRGHKPPGHPPTPCLGVSTRQLPAGDGLGHTRQGTGWGGPGGLRVGRPSFPNLTYTLERCKMQEIAPHPPKNRGKTQENTARAPTHPEERSATKAGEGKTRQGETHPPRENEESATRRKNKATKYRGKHLDGVAGLDEARAQRQASRSRRQKHKRKTQKKKNSCSCRQSVLHSCHPKGNKSWGTMQPPSLSLSGPQKEPKHPKAAKGQKL